MKLLLNPHFYERENWGTRKLNNLIKTVRASSTEPEFKLKKSDFKAHPLIHSI